MVTDGSVWQDARHALRSLRARPGFTTIAAGMLALAVGIATAMFTIVDALILRPVPFNQPDQLAFVMMSSKTGGRTTVAPAVLRAWRESPAFAGVESAVPETALVDTGRSVVTRGIARVTPGLFSMLGNVQPIRGRLFVGDEGRPGTDDRVLLSEDLWRSVYGADSAIVGRRVSIDGERLTVVGILPADLRFPRWNTVIWRPIDYDVPPARWATDRPTAYVRFAPSMPREEAVRVATEAAHASDSTTSALFARATPLAGLVLDEYYQRAVPLLAGGVILAFLVLCANVCSLLLSRLSAARREFSIRAALGASRRRLGQHAFLESAMVGALGASMGAAVGWALVSIARVFLPEPFLLRTLNPLNLDLRALAVTSITAIVTTLAASLIPAWIGTRVDAGDSLRAVDRGGTKTRAARALTRTLLVAEIAFACTLLAGATLLVRSFVNLVNADRGLNTSNVLTATMTLSSSTFRDRPSRAAVAGALEAEIRRIPGVEQLAWSFGLPPDGGAIHYGEWVSDAPGGVSLDMAIESYNVGPDFFLLYGIPLLRGRTFQSSDSERDTIIGQRLAQALWPGLAVLALSLGRALTALQYGVTASDPLTWILVLGVLAVTTLLAAWRPAREAARVDPVALLRTE